MKEIANTSLIYGESKTSILNSGPPKKVRETTTGVKKLVVEGIPHNRLFCGKGGKEQTIRDLHRFLADYKITAPRKGRVPVLSTQKQEKLNAKSPQKAPVSELPLSAQDRQALPATGTWPTLITNRGYVNTSLHQKADTGSKCMLC